MPKNIKESLNLRMLNNLQEEILDVNCCCFYLLSSNAKEYSSISKLLVFFGMGEFWSDVSVQEIFYPWPKASFLSGNAQRQQLGFRSCTWDLFFGLTLSSVYGILSLWQSFHLLLHIHSIHHHAAIHALAWLCVPICNVPVCFFWEYTFLVRCVPWMIRPLRDAF